MKSIRNNLQSSMINSGDSERLLTLEQKLVVKDSVQWFEEQRGKWEVADLLHLKVAIHLVELAVLMNGLLQLV